MPNSTGMAGSSYASAPNPYPWYETSAEHEITMPAFIEKSMAQVESYARREPWTFAAWVFGVGFVLGWKLKPW